MREIIFRGKQTDTKQYWIYGHGIYDEGFYSKLIIYDDSYRDEEGKEYNFFKYEDVFTETVGQFTGLYDKKGAKVFEDDIMELNCHGEKYIGLVKIIGCCGYICCKNKSWYSFEKVSKFNLCGAIRQFNAYVIGNIHDNPELLKDNSQTVS